ncbi:hypothetical protein HYT84_04385 [Candidatus Micrarchaeota archaeon]|nr:hypothetical protein [Candidatus Micrarchaeota archaeon]
MRRLFVFLIFVGLVFAPLSVESYKISPTKLKPGQNGVVEIILKNVPVSATSANTPTVNDISIYYSAVKGLTFESESPLWVGTLEGGASTIASIPVSILPDSKGGILSPTFSIQQRDGSLKQSLIVPIEVENPAILTLSLDKQTIEAIDTIKLKITNNGGSANKLILKLNDSDEFGFVNADQVFVGDVTTSKETEINIDARNAKDGLRILPLTIVYQDDNGGSRSELKNIQINVKKQKTDILFTQEESITTSIYDTLKLKLKNTGRKLDSVEIMITDQNIKPREKNEFKLNDFAIGEERTIEAEVFVNAQPGTNDMKIKIKWIENEVEKEEEIEIPVFVKSDSDVALFIESKPTPITVNTDHTLSILVSNIGSYKIENVETELLESNFFEILNAQRKQYIGGLESDDFSTVQYKIRTNNVKEGAYPLTTLVKYKDNSGIWVEKNVTAEVVVKETGNSKGGDNWIFYLILILIVVLIAFFYWRNKQKSISQK